MFVVFCASFVICVIFMCEGELTDYDTAVQTCYLDESLASDDPSILESGQSYWVSGKRVELGCDPLEGLCARLDIGKTLRSRTQSLDYICVRRLERRGLTRMAVQCADGYDVASIASYTDIYSLSNRFLFPTNRTMVIQNFTRPGYLTKCRTVVRDNAGVTYTYRDCGSLLPSLCNTITDLSDVLTTLTITEYRMTQTTTAGRIQVARRLPIPDDVTQSESTNSSLPDERSTVPDKDEINLFGLGLSAVHLLSIASALVFIFIVLLFIICVLVRRNRRHRKAASRDPPSVKDNENEYASWFSSKDQLTEGSKGSGGQEGSHYMTIPADMEYQPLDSVPAPDSHVYSDVSSEARHGRTRVFGRETLMVSGQR